MRVGRSLQPRKLLVAAAVCATAGLAPAGTAEGGADARRAPSPAPVGDHLVARGLAALAQEAPPARIAGERRPLSRTAPETGARAELGRDFYFTRAVHSCPSGYYRRCAWAVDYPKADRQFMYLIGRLLSILDAYEWENAVRLDDPDLRRYPFLYTLEVGGMNLNEAEVLGLRSYLEAGGFLVVDDFWGSWEWANFEREIQRVLPGRKIVDLPLDHPIFHQFYDIDELIQVPNVRNGVRGGPTHEGDGLIPHVRGIFDDDGELMVVINWNTDLGDAWEWAENPYYPIEYSNYAYELAVNYIVYGLTH